MIRQLTQFFVDIFAKAKEKEKDQKGDASAEEDQETAGIRLLADKLRGEPLVQATLLWLTWGQNIKLPCRLSAWKTIEY